MAIATPAPLPLDERAPLEVVVACVVVVAAAPAPDPAFVDWVLGDVVVVEGSTIDSSDSAVPELQLIEPPPAACQVEPITWRSSTG